MTVSDAVPDAVARGRRSIAGNFRSIFVGRLFAALSMWLALVLLAKLSDPATVGVYALAQAICIPVAEVAKMGLREIRASDTRGEYRFGDYFGLRLLTTVAFLSIIVASTLVQPYPPAVIWVIVLYSLTRCLDLVSDIIYSEFQSHERMDYMGRSLCILGPLSLLLLSVGYWLSGSLAVAVTGQLLAHVLVLGLYDIPVGIARGRLHGSDAFRPLWEPRALWTLALQAMPLAFATALVMVAVFLPRMVVENALGLSALGVFAALTALAMSPNRLVNSMGDAMSVRLAQYHAAGDARRFVGLLARPVLGVAFLGTLGVVLAAAFGDTILSLVYTSDYATHSGLLVWLIAAASIRCVADVLKFGMIASRQFWWLTVQYGVVALVAVLASFTLIPRLGLTGAGVAMLLIFSSHLAVVAVGLFHNLPRAGQPGLAA